MINVDLRIPAPRRVGPRPARGESWQARAKSADNGEQSRDSRERPALVFSAGERRKGRDRD